MGKFKSAMKAIGNGLAAVAEAALTPEYWFEEAARAAHRGDHKAARDYARNGIEASYRYRR